MLVSYWAPFTASVLLPPMPDDAQRADPDELAARWATACRRAPLVGGFGGLTLFSLVLGIPFAAGNAGITGFVVALMLTAGSSIATGSACGLALRALGASRSVAWRRALSCLSPFAAPRAIEVVYQHALAPATPSMAASVVLEAADFRAWIRPVVWDHLQGGDTRSDLDLILTRQEMASLVGDPGTGANDGGSTFCPRCGSAWRLPAGSCPACPGAIALTRLAG